MALTAYSLLNLSVSGCLLSGAEWSWQSSGKLLITQIKALEKQPHHYLSHGSGGTYMMASQLKRHIDQFLLSDTEQKWQ